jgi:hypothetical protein
MRSSISVRGNISGRDLAVEGGVGAQQKLLAGLAAGVKGAADLRATERTVRQQAAILARQGDALRDALVDDVRAHLGEAIDIGLPGAEVAPLDRVIKEPEHAVAVVLVILRRIDAALRRDGVGAPGRILIAEAFHLVAKLAQRGRGRAAREAGADDDDVVFPFVGGVDQLGFKLVFLPFFLDGTGRDFGIECHNMNR